MKTIYSIIALFSIVAAGAIKCSAAPNVDSIRVLPNFPTEHDIVKIAVYVSTPSVAKKLSIVPTISAGTIDITACYNSSNILAAMSFFADTLILGKLPDGKYKINVRAYYNYPENNPNCDNIIDSMRAIDSFYVMPTMPVSQQILPQNVTEDNSVKVVTTVTTPNPARKISLSHSISQNDILISGCFAKTQAISQPQIFYDTLTIGKLLGGKYMSQVTVFYSEGDTNICDVVVDVTNVADSFSVASGVGVTETQRLQPIVYPNPASDIIHLSLPDGWKLEHAILQDLRGKLLKRTKNNNVSIRELPPGLYILQVQTNKGRFVQKCRKE